MAKILVVDDDKKILNFITEILKTEYEVVTYTSIKEVPLNSLDMYDLIILDIMIPEVDGFEICKMIRNKVDCPILFITARTSENDIVYGLGLGADDYIQKPFGVLELRARINAHLRREKREHKCILNIGNVKFNLSAKKMFVKDKEVMLTAGEYKICEYLARNKGHVFSREQIYEAVFGYDGMSNDSTIATHIKNIRMKLEDRDKFPIKTVWGIGYVWEVKEI